MESVEPPASESLSELPAPELLVSEPPGSAAGEVGMVWQLADGTIQACNSAAEKILGFTIQQIQDRTSADQVWRAIHLDGSPFPGETHPVSVALQTGQSVTDVVMGLYQPDGSLVWLQIDAHALFQANATQPWAAVATFRDITATVLHTRHLQPQISEQPSLPQRTILIVEDCAADRELYLQYLSCDSHYHYRVLTAATGSEALELCRQVKFDAVLLDDCLTDFEARQILATLQQQMLGWCPPILVMVGQGSETIAVQLFKAGAEDYLIKREITASSLQTAVGTAIDKTELRLRLRQSAERERFVAQVAQQIRQSLDLPTILETTVTELRRLFETDRVLIFQCNPRLNDKPNLSVTALSVTALNGTVIAESVGSDWQAVMAMSPTDSGLVSWAEDCLESYQPGWVSAIADIYNAGLEFAQVEKLARHQVRANLMTAIWQGEQLWGLLIVHHCASVRLWQTVEIELLQQLSTQVGTAIQQAELYQQAQIELRERQRIETELRRSEGFTRQILESSSDCIQVLDLESRLLYMNPSGQAQMGICDFSQFERRQWVTFWQGEHRIAAQKALATATTGGTSRFEGFCPTVAGVPKWWEVQISPIRNAAGQVERLLSTSRDITARKASELAIQAGSDRMQLLYETTQALLVSEHPLALIETLFHKLEAMLAFDCCFNYLLDDPQFKPDCTRLRLASSFGISQELADRWQLLAFGQGICGEVAQQRRQIVEVEIQQSTTPKLAPLRALGMMAYASQPLISQGKLFGTLAFGSRSRSQFSAAETQFLQTLCDQISIAFDQANLIGSLQQQTEQLRQADQLKDEFLAVLSHELRTPLTPILGWSKLLLSQCLNAREALEAIATIDRNAKLQAQLVEDLLDISRIMRGKLSLDAAPVDLAQVLTAALETIDLAAQARTICLKTTIDAEVPPVWGDAGRLQQVVWNLLSNAVKFTPEQGCVEIWLSRLGQQAQIQIRDTGKGIAPDFLPHLFEYFRQEDGTTTRKFGGLGLGLAIAKQIVELHGGTIRTESLGVGQGATFTVQLPLSKSHLPAIAPPATPAPLAPLTDLHILVVDDENDTRTFIRYLLEENGATVTAVGSALAALQDRKSVV